ncbi:MAG: lipopolysaccharide heptosyltransferase II [Planctomycetota bacterium]|nr:MAG: lipopolysaccharide heptosyltransferase II [Planctomycetota bacterium]
MNIGVFVPNWIGDAAMCTPTLRALSRRFPDGNLVGIMRPYVVDVLAGTPWLRESIIFHHRASHRSERTWQVLRRMRHAQLDAVVLLTNSMRSAALAWASGAGTRVGYARYGRGPLLTHRLYCPRTGSLGLRRLPWPEIDAYLQVAYALGCEPESPRLELATLPEDERAADAVWEKWNLPPGDQVVLLNSSGAYGASKLWPSEYFAELAARLASRRGLAVLVVCGPNERDVARRIVRLANHTRVVSLADEPISIGLTKACVRRSRLMVTTDSGPRFFAVAFDVPVITLFGPTDVAWTRTHSPREVCLNHDVPCGPCGKRKCPLSHHDCMRQLSVDRVFEAVKQQLDHRRVVEAA